MKKNQTKKYKWLLEVTNTEFFAIIQEKILTMEVIIEILDYIKKHHPEATLVIIATYMYVEENKMTNQQYMDLKKATNNPYQQHYGFDIIIN